MVVSVAATDTTAADYPGDKVTLPPATTGRPVRAQASQGTQGAWWVGMGRDTHLEVWGGFSVSQSDCVSDV